MALYFRRRIGGYTGDCLGATQQAAEVAIYLAILGAVELAVVRHTRLDIESGRCYGQSEIGLADSFEQEFEQLRASLRDSYSAIYTSPLQRCVVLAERLGKPVRHDSRLLEYAFGDWEMQRWDDIDATRLDQWMQDFVNQRPPNGESLVDMQARVGEFMDELRARDYEHCLLVTHAGVIRCIWAYLLRIPLRQIFKIEVGYGGVLNCRLATDPQADVIYSRSPRDAEPV